MKKESIQNTICLDHFYVEFPSNEIQQFRMISKGIERCMYKEVISGSDSWRGVYMMSNLGSYFEMLESSSHFRLGIAASPYLIQYTDAMELTKEFAHLSWEKHKRKWRDTGKLWFKWASLRPKHEKDRDQEALWTWLMQYGRVHAPDRGSINAPAAVDRFQRLTLEISEQDVPTFRYHSQWLPGKQLFGRKKVELVIPNRDSSEFLIEINVKKIKMPPFCSCNNSMWASYQLES
jgi:hypothetical protein